MKLKKQRYQIGTSIIVEVMIRMTAKVNTKPIIYRNDLLLNVKLLFEKRTRFKFEE